MNKLIQNTMNQNLLDFRDLGLRGPASVASKVWAKNLANNMGRPALISPPKKWRRGGKIPKYQIPSSDNNYGVVFDPATGKYVAKNQYAGFNTSQLNTNSLGNVQKNIINGGGELGMGVAYNKAMNQPGLVNPMTGKAPDTTKGTGTSATTQAPKTTPDYGSAISGGISGAAGLGTQLMADKDFANQAVSAEEQETSGGGTKGALSGLGTGASLGASVGSLVGPVGTAIGGAVGAIGGALTGLFSGKSAEKKRNAKIREAKVKKEQQKNNQIYLQQVAQQNAINDQKRVGESVFVRKLGGTIYNRNLKQPRFKR